MGLRKSSHSGHGIVSCVGSTVTHTEVTRWQRIKRGMRLSWDRFKEKPLGEGEFHATYTIRQNKIQVRELRARGVPSLIKVLTKLGKIAKENDLAGVEYTSYKEITQDMLPENWTVSKELHTSSRAGRSYRWEVSGKAID